MAANPAFTVQQFLVFICICEQSGLGLLPQEGEQAALDSRIQLEEQVHELASMLEALQADVAARVRLAYLSTLYCSRRAQWWMTAIMICSWSSLVEECASNL